MTQLLYVIGVPGAGKSRLVQQLTAHVPSSTLMRPFAHQLLLEDGRPFGAVLGRYRPGYGGTDTLAFDVQPKVVQWLAEHPYGYVLGEGDRLSTGKFFSAVREAGVELTLVHLNTPPDVAEERRARRNRKVDESWLAGRASKVAALAVHADIVLDGAHDTATLIEALRGHPVVARLEAA